MKESKANQTKNDLKEVSGIPEEITQPESLTRSRILRIILALIAGIALAGSIFAAGYFVAGSSITQLRLPSDCPTLRRCMPGPEPYKYPVLARQGFRWVWVCRNCVA